MATPLGTLAGPAEQPMHMPTAVAVDAGGRVVVADGARDRIGLFAPDGGFQRYLTSIGNEPLNRPVGLQFDAQGRLWIADTGSHRLLVASPELSLIEKIDLPPDDRNRACDATDVTVTPDGKRAYVVDNDGHRLLIRDNATGKWTTLGTSGRAIGQFQWPFMACVGKEGYLHVTEAIGARVQSLSPNDKWAGTIGSWGVELGQLYRPKGITADPAGRIFVSDSTTNVVQVFGPRGSIEGAVTDAAGNLLRFEHPMGLCLINGKLYVVELRANRVAVLALPVGR